MASKWPQQDLSRLVRAAPATSMVGAIPAIFAALRGIVAKLDGSMPMYDLKTLGLVALVSGLVPARRASAIDPITALRYE